MKRTNITTYWRWAIVIAVAASLVFVMPGFAQRSQRGQSSAQGDFRMEPLGWISVAYDLNDDGVYETFERVYYYDLEQARRQSRERQMREGRGQMRRDRGMQQDRPGRRQRQQMGRMPQYQPGRGQRQQQMDRMQQDYRVRPRVPSRIERSKFEKVDGTIIEMKDVKLAGFDEKHVVARIKNRENMVAKVDLGPKGRISDLDINKGQSVSAWGKRGTINEKYMLMAYWINVDGNRVSIKRPKDMNLKRYTGKILKLKKTAFGEKTGNHVMARVELDKGGKTIVNLGPENQLGDLNVQSGKEFSMLARPVVINGRKALVAEQVMMGDKTATIDWEKAKKG